MTENLECGSESIVVYSNREVSESIAREIDDINIHFQGRYKLLVLEEKSSLNGQNECVFRHNCKGTCYSVFIQIRDVSVENAWKICEVKFE